MDHEDSDEHCVYLYRDQRQGQFKEFHVERTNAMSRTIRSFSHLSR
jgi:hypothetical protein